MVGEHHDVVRARRRRHDALEHPEHLVEPLERPQRLRPGGARVVGDLVVVHEVDVHDRRQRSSRSEVRPARAATPAATRTAAAIALLWIVK